MQQAFSQLYNIKYAKHAFSKQLKNKQTAFISEQGSRARPIVNLVFRV